MKNFYKDARYKVISKEGQLIPNYSKELLYKTKRNSDGNANQYMSKAIQEGNIELIDDSLFQASQMQ